MPKRIYTPDEYFKGLEEQGIVVHDAMRLQIKNLNAHGVVEGNAPLDSANNPLLPANDARYEAGYMDRKREAQQRLDDYRRLEEAEVKPPGMSPQGLTVTKAPPHGTEPPWPVPPIAPASIYGEGTLKDGSIPHPLDAGGKTMLPVTRAELSVLIQHALTERNFERVNELVKLLV